MNFSDFFLLSLGRCYFKYVIVNLSRINWEKK